jgi:FlaA1/EpsC-like NDP-sugar epimerase
MMYAGKRTLVTGGNGSFGQTMVRRVHYGNVTYSRGSAIPLFAPSGL